ncbi:GmrSD restriction endonuclease domain-containing protein [Priestia aryabhattai]|uniref:GmrSD restriction endonuclease domain-containing protein n=1 Tax=Priestia aryabhattai TaxID=412384 RepID=UPI001C8D4962|nr:DUF262 domain-containing protein [Priestia aryabhattai]MBX9986364.1 DUF262 domain-containing protein [Priestia aryabhattai]MBY0001967.1 DUF262 domain-containing protein [Priestia aryabhattai]
MNISPKGMSILEVYNLYRNSQLIVNRKYQRKLVWSPEEKVMLIDSIMQGYPLPLFLFAKDISFRESSEVEILDGVQRLTAIFDFIENRIPWENKRFDLSVFPAANENYKNGVFEIDEELLLFECLDSRLSSQFLSYQLAVTTFESFSENKMIDVFGRINSQGRQLSLQEKRQAGVINDFSELVREVAELLRGDTSKERVYLYDMPEISLEDTRTSNGYKIMIEDMFWYSSGVLGRNNIRNGEDEEIIADLLVSVIMDEPFEVSRESLDSLYKEDSKLYKTININLNRIGIENIKRDFLKVFEIVRGILSIKIDGRNFRHLVSNQTRNPVKYSFYAFFIAVYRLVIKENMVPENNLKIMERVEGLQSKLVQGRHSVKKKDRVDNIKVVNGLIRDEFTADTSQRIGKLGTEYEFERTLALARSETEAFEFKQGFLSLSPKGKKFNPKVVEKILKTSVAMANRASINTSYIYVGIADDLEDATRRKDYFFEDYIVVSQKYIVGIDDEIKANEETLDDYIRRFLSEIDKYDVSEAVKVQVSNFNIKQYRGKQFIEIGIEKTTDVCLFEGKIFVREGSNTKEVDPSNVKKVIEIGKRFGSFD